MPKQTKQSALRILERRLRVSVMVIAGVSYEQIAKAENVSKATVCSDVKAIEKAWFEQQCTNIAHKKAKDLRRLDEALFALYPMIRSGNLDAIDKLVKVIGLRGKMLGYEITKVDATVSGEITTRAPAEQLSPADIWKLYGDIVRDADRRDADAAGDAPGSVGRPAPES